MERRSHTALYPAARTTGDAVDGFSAVPLWPAGPAVANRAWLPTAMSPTRPPLNRSAAWRRLDRGRARAPSFGTPTPCDHRHLITTCAAARLSHPVSTAAAPASRLSARGAGADRFDQGGDVSVVHGRQPVSRRTGGHCKEINLRRRGFAESTRHDTEQTSRRLLQRGVLRRLRSKRVTSRQTSCSTDGSTVSVTFPGRVFRVWGARTAGPTPRTNTSTSAAPLFLEPASPVARSVVFENTGPRL